MLKLERSVNSVENVAEGKIHLGASGIKLHHRSLREGKPRRQEGKQWQCQSENKPPTWGAAQGSLQP
jgi:hypothetical protein